MEELVVHMQKICSCVVMELDNKEWAGKANIPSQRGWYFIRTDTPVEVLRRQKLWASTYTQVNGKTARVKNYNLARRAGRYQSDLSEFWNLAEVYSGMHANLRERAKQHVLPDAGTGALALGRYPELMRYEWLFFFAPMELFRIDVSCPEMLVRLGEQTWRSKHGWPLLCAN